jgi:hypothetical protein
VSDVFARGLKVFSVFFMIIALVLVFALIGYIATPADRHGQFMVLAADGLIWSLEQIAILVGKLFTAIPAIIAKL